MEFVDRPVVLHELLDDLGISHAMGGALALAYHAEPRSTVEIDVNVFVPRNGARRIIESLSAIGIEPPETDIEGMPPIAGVRCTWDDTHVDLFFPYDDEFFASVQERAESHIFVDFEGRRHVLPFLSAEDLTIFKITFDRPKDWVDIGSMLEERPLDCDYVERWLLHLKGERSRPSILRFLDLFDEIRSTSG